MSDFMEKLEELRKKQPSELSPSDIEFLAARRSYLQPHELKSFGIEEPTESSTEASDSAEDEGTDKPAKKSKAKPKDSAEDEE